MQNANNESVSTRVQTFSFDNDTLTFSIDLSRIEAAVTSELVDSLVGVALKTLIHRTNNRPKGDGEDATDWLIEALQGGAAAGRFRVTDADKARASVAMKAFKMAPDQTLKQFADTYGVEFVEDAEWLAKHYMNVRAAEAQAAKAKANML